jgi:hypothetical protein
LDLPPVRGLDLHLLSNHLDHFSFFGCAQPPTRLWSAKVLSNQSSRLISWRTLLQLLLLIQLLLFLLPRRDPFHRGSAPGAFRHAIRVIHHNLRIFAREPKVQVVLWRQGPLTLRVRLLLHKLL